MHRLTLSPRRAAGYAARDLSISRAIQKHGPAYLELVGLARGLALLSGREGITVADVREAAQKHLDTLPALATLSGLGAADKGAGRKLSWLGGVMKSAGLIPTDRIRRSHIEGSHANRHVVWLHPNFAPPATR